ncbi:MAG: ATP-grasp domain-containing protein [bacterium]
MSASRPLTVLCLASEEKGHEFLRECKRQGCRVLLVTRQKLADADWPKEAIDDVFFLTTLWERDDLLKGVSFLARTQEIDRIVPLDDYDVEGAAVLREHLRIPGMGDATARYFRDKLAMRVKAKDHGIPVPEFVPVINYGRIREYMERVSAPWLLKPRSEAAAFGIKKVLTPDELWKMLDGLGDRQSFYVPEQYVPASIYHVDAIVSERAVIFAAAHRYGHSPMDVTYSGGISSTRTLPRASAEAQALTWLNREVVDTLGLVRGVTHTEFIRGRDD